MKTEMIRQHLRGWLLATNQHCADDLFIDELCIINKKNRADLVHINGRLCGFEIKSESDSLKRWPDQRAAYKLVFDEVWLCCHRKHASRALSDSDTSCGIIIFDEFDSMAILRPAKSNRIPDPIQLCGLLWRVELDSLCDQNGLPVIRSELIASTRKRIASSLPLTVIQQTVLAVLKKRYAS